MPFFRKVLETGRNISDFLRPMQIPLHSAYTCFFLVLSLFPGLLLLLGLLRYTTITVQDLTALLEGFLPERLMPVVRSLITASYKHSSGTVVTVSVLGMLYSASRGMFGIRNGLDAIYTPSREHGYFRRRSISVLYNASFLLVLLLTLALYLAGAALVDYLWMTTHPVLMALLRAIDLRSVVLLLLQIGVFTGMYALLPGKRNRLSRSLPGAVFSAFGWLVFSHLFSVYVEHFALYTNIYGSVYALALGMLWLYFCICIFFYGGALNCYLADRRPS
ncbi:MAG: YihY/virulence factor BrkB family protein [Oscillospiraceae bacterium]|nr:YihY/virulence factor BrkB family protein [Oscillospiraceae bacterium]